MAQHKDFRVLGWCLRASSPSQARTCRKDQIQQPYRHDRRSCPTTTVQRCRRSPPVDDQFGTHRHDLLWFIARTLARMTTLTTRRSAVTGTRNITVGGGSIPPGRSCYWRAYLKVKVGVTTVRDPMAEDERAIFFISSDRNTPPCTMSKIITSSDLPEPRCGANRLRADRSQRHGGEPGPASHHGWPDPYGQGLEKFTFITPPLSLRAAKAVARGTSSCHGSVRLLPASEGIHWPSTP